MEMQANKKVFCLICTCMATAAAESPTHFFCDAVIVPPLKIMICHGCYIILVDQLTTKSCRRAVEQLPPYHFGIWILAVSTSSSPSSVCCWFLHAIISPLHQRTFTYHSTDICICSHLPSENKAVCPETTSICRTRTTTSPPLKTDQMLK